MRVQGFTAKGFRGLWRYSVEIDPRRAFVLYGLNGTGKSSLFSGLQFGVTGELPELPASDVSPKKVFRHAVLDPEDPAIVEVHFEDEGEFFTVRREIRADGSQKDIVPAELEGLVNDPESRLCFLTRDDFSRMIDDAEEDRWERLSPLLGHEDLARFRSGLRLLSLRVKKDLDLSTKRSQVEALRSDISRIDERYNLRLAELELKDFSASILKEELVKLVADESEEARGEISGLGDSDALENLDWGTISDGLGGTERLSKLGQQSTQLSRETSLLEFNTYEAEELAELIDLLRGLHEDPKVGHQILHAEFFENASAVVAEYRDEKCPVCGLRPEDWGSVREDLSSKMDELGPKVAEKKKITRQARAVLSRLKSAAKEFEQHREEHGLTKELEGVYDELRSVKDLLARAVKNLEGTPATGTDESERMALEVVIGKLDDTKSKTLASLESEAAEIAAEIDTLEGADDRVRLGKLETLAESYLRRLDKTEQLDALSTWLEEAETVVEEFKQFDSIVEKAEGDLSTSMLEDVGDRVHVIFQGITGNPHLEPEIKRESERGVPKAAISIKDFYGAGERPAREYLSESNRNALGLSIYFAGMELRSPKCGTFVMDDITHSTDLHHRRGLANFLHTDLAKAWQVILLTHDKEWFGKLQSLFEGGAKYSKILDWELTGIRHESDEWQPLRSKARERIKDDDIGAGPTLRMALEEFMEKVCERYRIHVPYKRHSDEIRFETMRQNLVARLGELRAEGDHIIDPDSSAVQAFKRSKDLANLASHFFTARTMSGIALPEALKDFEEFADLFICTREFDGERCGWMLDSLRNTRDGPVECKKCRREFCE